jgi:hypothetical protein
MKLRLILTTTLTLLFTACTNIGGPTPSEDISFAGIVDGTASSPTLNGQRLVLSSASVTQDDAPAKASDLRPGMEVSGKGRSNGSEIEVESLEFEDRVKGQIDVINTTDNTIDVAGIRVAIDANAKIVNRNADGSFTDITLTDLQGDDYIEIHGVPRNADTVLGMFILRKIEDNLRVEFRMHIRNLDSVAKTFTYGLQTYTVDYKDAEVRGNLTENAMVRVRGVRDGQVIRAERVRYGNGSDDNNGGNDDGIKGKLELEGPISSWDATSETFTLLDFVVDYSNAEVRGNLAEGVWVEVKGNVNSASEAVKATQVKVEDGDDDNEDNDSPNRKGTVEAMDSAAMTLTVSGISYWADAATIVENESSHITFADLKVGDFVEVKYDSTKLNDAGHSYASKIEIKTDDDGDSDDDDGDKSDDSGDDDSDDSSDD